MTLIKSTITGKFPKIFCVFNYLKDFLLANFQILFESSQIKKTKKVYGNFDRFFDANAAAINVDTNALKTRKTRTFFSYYFQTSYKSTDRLTSVSSQE